MNEIGLKYKIFELRKIIEELKERIEGTLIDIDNLQQEIFGHDEYMNWIYSELGEIKRRLKGDSDE